MRVLIFHTGGTLMMRGGDPSPLVPDVFTRDILAELPVLARVAEIESRILFALDSSDMQPEHWVTIAEAVYGALCETRADGGRRFDGIVIVHGTDTMAYTASALSFLLGGIDRPVILTGAQRPLGEVRTDARANLVDACFLATQAIPEVAIAFSSKLYRGNRAVKLDAWSMDAFGSPTCPPLADLGVTLETGDHILAAQPPVPFDRRIEPRVLGIRVFPGLDPAIVAGALDTGIQGLLLVAFGSGNVPQRERSLIPIIAEATARDIPVVVVSQCVRGGVDLRRYEGGVSALSAGAISGGAMTPEAAVTKLMVALGRGSGQPKVALAREAFANIWAGEDDAM